MWKRGTDLWHLKQVLRHNPESALSPSEWINWRSMCIPTSILASSCTWEYICWTDEGLKQFIYIPPIHKTSHTVYDVHQDINCMQLSPYPLWFSAEVNTHGQGECPWFTQLGINILALKCCLATCYHKYFHLWCKVVVCVTAYDERHRRFGQP